MVISDLWEWYVKTEIENTEESGLRGVKKEDNKPSFTHPSGHIWLAADMRVLKPQEKSELETGGQSQQYGRQ